MESAHAVWETYLPVGKNGRKPLRSTQQPPPQEPKNQGGNVDPQLVKALGDTTWTSVNQATMRLMKRTGAYNPAELINETKLKAHPAPAPVVVVVEVDPAFKFELRKPPPPPPPPPAPAVEDPVRAPAPRLPKDNRVEVLLPERVPEPPPIHAIEAHPRRDHHLNLFAQNIERPHHATNNMLIPMPPLADTLQMCLQFRETVPWMNRNAMAIEKASAQITYPKMPVMRRDVLRTFLREPDPRCSYERPCLNLDREPLPHELMGDEPLQRCIAHRLSAEQLGADKAYRCRELLFHAQMVHINAAVEFNKKRLQDSSLEARYPAADPNSILGPVREYCYMCHLYTVFHACLDQKNARERRERKDMSNAAAAKADETLTRIFNRFMVYVNQIGEYDRRACLCADDMGYGIWGMFPRWVARNYVVCTISNLGGLRGFVESPILDFQEARESSQRTESSSLSNSTQSAPTVSARNATRSPL